MTPDIPARVDAALAKTDLDALLTTSAESSKYLSGAPLPFQLYYPKRPTTVLWPLSGSPVLFTGSDQLAGPAATSWITDLRGYVENGRPTADCLAELLAEALVERGLERARIGYEYLLMPVAVNRAIAAVLPDLELVPADAFLDALRATKTPSEIARLRAVARSAELGTRAALEDARAGWTERQLARRIAARIGDAGADTVPMLLAGVGEGARMFSEPTDRELEPGQFVRIDLNATLQGYYADLGRMAVVGEPTGEQSAAYDAHIELNRRILKAMRPGATCAEMFAVQQEEGRRLGVELLEQPSIGFGHAIGTNANDAPKLMASDATVLEEGMVFNIEPDVIGRTASASTWRRWCWSAPMAASCSPATRTGRRSPGSASHELAQPLAPRHPADRDDLVRRADHLPDAGRRRRSVLARQLVRGPGAVRLAPGASDERALLRRRRRAGRPAARDGRGPGAGRLRLDDDPPGALRHSA
jgi:Xaa-Pro dipeptidase